MTGPGGKRNCVVVHAHPNPESFSAALRDRAVAGLERAGHEVTVIDLYQQGYQPAMTADEHRDYDTIAADHPDPATAEHITAIKGADTLVFVYPTWWSGLPAILKGWLDRTLLPGVAFTLAGTVTPALTNITRIVGITTYGSGRAEVGLLGDGGRRTITRTVRLVCSRRCRTTWLGLHRLDTASDEERVRFLDRVEQKLAGL